MTHSNGPSGDAKSIRWRLRVHLLDGFFFVTGDMTKQFANCKATSQCVLAMAMPSGIWGSYLSPAVKPRRRFRHSKRRLLFLNAARALWECWFVHTTTPVAAETLSVCLPS